MACYRFDAIGCHLYMVVVSRMNFDENELIFIEVQLGDSGRWVSAIVQKSLSGFRVRNEVII